MRTGIWQSVSNSNNHSLEEDAKFLTLWHNQVLSGAAGLTYGAESVMSSYSTGTTTSGPEIPWYEEIHLPGATQMQYVPKAIFDRGKASYFSRIPSQDIIVGDAGEYFASAVPMSVVGVKMLMFSW